jgi:class 3 adenylate cyclase
MGEQVQACVLFSDIRDFTEYTAKRGDRRAFDLLHTHNSIAADHIRAHQGEVLKTYGDGMMAWFENPAQATSAAIAIQQAFNAHTQQHPEEPLLVGMGLHRGDVIQEGKDLFGHTVNLAKRLADEALSSQILVSQILIEALRPQKTSFLWVDLGDRNLKGIGRERVYEVIWRRESARLTTKDQSLNLVLTEENKLVLELSKHVQAQLEQVREQLRSQREKHSGLARWIHERVERWVPQIIDRALLGAGIGIEHALEQVQLFWQKGKLHVRLGQKPQFTIDGAELDRAEVQKFIRLLQTKRRDQN